MIWRGIFRKILKFSLSLSLSLSLHLLEVVQGIHWLVKFHVDLAQIEEHIDGAEVLQGRFKLSFSIAIQSQPAVKLKLKNGSLV